MWIADCCVDRPVWALTCVACNVMCGLFCVDIDMCGLLSYVWTLAHVACRVLCGQWPVWLVESYVI